MAGEPTNGSTDKTVPYKVGIPVFVMAGMSFVGWILLILFGGVGLSALPIDLIIEFNNRPEQRSISD